MSTAPGGVANALGSIFRTQRVQVGSIAYASGQTIPIDIPRGLLLKSVKIRLSGVYNVVGAVITSWNSEAPLGLLKRIELKADGRKPFVSTDGQMLYRRNQFSREVPAELINTTLLAVAAYPFSAYVAVDLESIKSINPVFSYLDTRLYDNLRLEITWGSVSDIAVIGASVPTITGCVADIQCEFTTEGFEHVLFNKLLLSDEVAITATQSALRLPVARNGLLQSIEFRTLRDAIVDDTLINNITLRSENSVLHMDHLTWATMQAANVSEYGLQVPFATGSIGARLSGYALHDLSEDFDFLTSLDTASLNTLDLLFDVTLGGGTSRLIKMLYTYLEPAGR
jgi:hypothetical protein